MRYNVHQSRNKIGRFHRGPRRGRAGRDTGAAECRSGAEHKKTSADTGITYVDATGFKIDWAIRV